MRYVFFLAFFALLISGCAPARYPPGHHLEASQTPHLGDGGIIKRGNPYQIDGLWYYPLADGQNYDATGVASWYGEKFHGKKTANGEVYSMYAMTAAHKTLPLPSVVRVTNLRNGKSIEVRVNDRGPFVKSRLIDLSYAAAKALGYQEQGTTEVRVETIHSADVSHLPYNEPKNEIDFVKKTEANNKIEAVGKIEAISPSAIEELPKQIPTVEMAYVQVGAFSSLNSANQVASQVANTFKTNAQSLPVQIVPSGEIWRVRLGPYVLDADAEVALNDVKKNGFDAAMIIHD